jgi:hypothetical protein
MSNKYRETALSGSSYIRCDAISITNGQENKRIKFNESEVITLEDGRVTTKSVGSVGEFFSEENADTTFSVLNPADNSDTGATMSYQDLYLGLYSLYLHLATERDAAQEAAAAEEPPAEEPAPAE